MAHRMRGVGMGWPLWLLAVPLLGLGLTGGAALARDDAAEAGATAPAPFSADVLRDAIGVGEMWRFRVTEGDQPPYIETMRVVSVTWNGAGFLTTYGGTEGTGAPAPDGYESSWSELESHATYPAASTQIEEATFEVPAGTYEGWRYTVQQDDGSTVVAEFARDQPGPPVRMVISSGGQPVTTMELLEHRDGSPTAQPRPPPAPTSAPTSQPSAPTSQPTQ